MHTASKTSAVTAIVFLGPFLSSIAVGQTVVWTDADARKIQQRSVNGGAVSIIVQFPSDQSAQWIHYEPISRKLYYLFFAFPGSGGVFQRSNVDGTAPENLSTPNAGAFALNTEARKIHWITSGSTINRSELDGTGVEGHTYSACCVLALGAQGDDLFFGAGLTLQKGIWRANADGSNEQFLHQTGSPRDFAYDPVEQKLYVATIDRIVRLNTDGTGFETIVQQPAWPDGEGPEHVEVDYRGRKLYWVDRAAKVIQRSNLDGSNIEDFLTASEAGNPNLNLNGLTIIQPPSIPATSTLGLIGLCLVIIVTGCILVRVRHRDRSSIFLNGP